MDLAARLEHLRDTTRDVVADTRMIEMVIPDGTPHLSVPGAGQYPLTRHASTQLAEKVGIPQRYFDRMAGSAPDLLAANVNRWLLQEPERRLIRVADGQVRALLSERYRPLDSYDLAVRVAERAVEHQAHVVEASLSETRMYLKLTVPGARESLGALTPVQKAEAVRSGRGIANLDADYVVPGLVVSNSDVGAGAFRVEPYVYRLVCSNGMIGEMSLKQIHVGEKLDLGEIVFSERTQSLSDKTLWSKVSDVLDATFTPSTFRAMLDRLKGAQNVALPKVVEVVDVVARDLGITEERKARILQLVSVEGPTAYGLAQAITGAAQDAPGVDEQVAAERYAGTLIADPVHTLGKELVLLA